MKTFLGYTCSCTSFVAISKGSRRNFALFNIVFELDSGLFLTAATAEGAQQSNTQQYDIMLHPPFFVVKLVGHQEHLVGPTLATPLGIAEDILAYAV